MGRARAWFSCLLALAATAVTSAQETPPGKPWSNETELSIALTEGNSDTQSIAFKDTFKWRWPMSRFQLKVDVLRSANADDWFEQVDPGFTWEPGETPTGVTSSLVKPPSELDAENYFIEGRYDRTIRKELNWNAGASWDSNEDAGIESRYILFAGFGHLWVDREDRRFLTSYGLSWTDRREETPDPEKEERFAGVRLSWTYMDKLGKNTTFDHDWTVNVSLADRNDWSSDMTNALSVSMSKRLSLRVSLRWLFNHEPALTDVDQVARVVIRDPDGIPGNGDEFFETLADGGNEIVFGETRVRKDKLDQVFKTTLVVSF